MATDARILNPGSSFPDQIAGWLRGPDDAPLVEYEGRWYSRSEAAALAARLTALLEDAAIPAGASIGIVARNRPAMAIAILGLIAAGRSITMIYSAQSAEAMARDFGALDLCAIIADPEDWQLKQREAAVRAGSAAIAIDMVGVALLDRPASGRDAPGLPAERGIRMLTSGTTGAPKRIMIPYSVLERAAESFRFGAGEGAPQVQIVSHPFGNISGICQLTGCAVAGAPMALLARFTVDGYVAALGRHRPPLMALAPPAVRMILDADVPREAFAGVDAVFGGGGALPAETQAAFEARYGIPIYWGYGATEFGGTLIRWTAEMHRDFGVSKRGSVGRVMAGAEIRVVDPASGSRLACGEVGLMEGRVALMGPDWIRTTDLVSIDADGFVWHHARADGAIVRGGFKILPEMVCDQLRAHPAVADAAVVGLADARLGQIPVAAVEIRPGMPVPTPAELDTHLRGLLPATHIPAQIRVLDLLPRTPSLKVSLGDVRSLFEG